MKVYGFRVTFVDDCEWFDGYDRLCSCREQI